MMRKAAIGTTLAALSTIVFAVLAQEPATKTGRPAPKGGVEGRLTWVDRQGKTVATAGEPGFYRTLTVSPDGKRMAFERNDAQTQNRDIWVADASGDHRIRLTSNPGWEAFPTWSPDGRRIVFTSNRSGVYNLYEKSSNGAGEETLLYQSTESKGPTSWSRDGKYLVYYSLGQPTHVRLLAASGPPTRQPVPVVDTQFTSITPRFSPDGKWIAYTSNESGQNEVSVRPFNPSTGAIGPPVVITHDGGRTPLWRGDGREIFYMTGDGSAMAMGVNSTGGFKTETPKKLFQLPPGVLFWDVAPDGAKFLFPVPNA